MRITVIAWWIWGLLALAMILLPIAGCNATTGPYKAVCAVQPIGMTDSGVVAVRVYCEPE